MVWYVKEGWYEWPIPIPNEMVWTVYGDVYVVLCPTSPNDLDNSQWVVNQVFLFHISPIGKHTTHKFSNDNWEQPMSGKSSLPFPYITKTGTYIICKFNIMKSDTAINHSGLVTHSLTHQNTSSSTAQDSTLSILLKASLTKLPTHRPTPENILGPYFQSYWGIHTHI